MRWQRRLGYVLTHLGLGLSHLHGMAWANLRGRPDGFWVSAEVEVGTRLCRHVALLRKAPRIVLLTLCGLSTKSGTVGVGASPSLGRLLCIRHVPSRISSFLHLAGGFVEICSRDISLLMSFAGELVSRWTFYSVCGCYGVGRHRLKSHDNLEGTLAHSLTPLKIVRELGNIEQLSPISLVSAYVVLKIHLE